MSLKNDNTAKKDGSTGNKVEGSSEPENQSSVAAGSVDDVPSFSDLVPLIEKVVKNVLKKEGNRKGKSCLPPNQKTMEFFFVKKK